MPSRRGFEVLGVAEREANQFQPKDVLLTETLKTRQEE